MTDEFSGNGFIVVVIYAGASSLLVASSLSDIGVCLALILGCERHLLRLPAAVGLHAHHSLVEWGYPWDLLLVDIQVFGIHRHLPSLENGVSARHWHSVRPRILRKLDITVVCGRVKADGLSLTRQRVSARWRLLVVAQHDDGALRELLSFKSLGSR